MLQVFANKIVYVTSCCMLLRPRIQKTFKYVDEAFCENSVWRLLTLFAKCSIFHVRTENIARILPAIEPNFFYTVIVLLLHWNLTVLRMSQFLSVFVLFCILGWSLLDKFVLGSLILKKRAAIKSISWQNVLGLRTQNMSIWPTKYMVITLRELSYFTATRERERERERECEGANQLIANIDKKLRAEGRLTKFLRQ